jgi:predicted DNA-binding transcriptional regulator AlpA
VPKIRRPGNRRPTTEEEPAGALMTIEDFCRFAKISRTLYYELRNQGDGPIEIRVGRNSPRISREEADAWARRMTAKRAKQNEEGEA